MSVPWQTVPIFGDWLTDAGNLRRGTYKITSNAQVVSTSGDAIVLPKGVVKYGQLNTNESALGGHSLVYEAPASDDPDMFPQGVTLQVEVTREGAQKVTFLVQPLLSMLNETEPGLDLNSVVLPQIFQPAPFPVAGVPGGLAKINGAGYVVDARGNILLPGGGEGGSSTLVETVSPPIATWNVPNPFGRLCHATFYIDGEAQEVGYVVTDTQVVAQFPFPVEGHIVLS